MHRTVTQKAQVLLTTNTMQGHNIHYGLLRLYDVLHKQLLKYRLLLDTSLALFAIITHELLSLKPEHVFVALQI